MTAPATPDPRDALADQIAAELAASDKAYRERATAAARLDDWLMQTRESA